MKKTEEEVSTFSPIIQIGSNYDEKTMEQILGFYTDTINCIAADAVKIAAIEGFSEVAHIEGVTISGCDLRQTIDKRETLGQKKC